MVILSSWQHKQQQKVEYMTSPLGSLLDSSFKSMLIFPSESPHKKLNHISLCSSLLLLFKKNFLGR